MKNGKSFRAVHLAFSISHLPFLICHLPDSSPRKMMKTVSLLLLTIILAPAAVVQGQTRAQTAGQKPGASARQTSPQPAKPADKKAEDCGCEVKAPPDVLATVDSTNVSVKEIDEPIKDRIQALQDQVIEARKRELDLQINSRLLEAEAKRLGTTSDKLLEREIVSKVKPPTDAEAQAFYDQNKSRIEGQFADVKDQIIGYLRGQREKDEAGKYADRLRARAQVKMLTQDGKLVEVDADKLFCGKRKKISDEQLKNWVNKK